MAPVVIPALVPTLHQVKAHDVRAFAASKAFQSGVSLEQILSACHLKSHNTFTQFYLKDVAWADKELFHLGPVVAAHQVHQQAPKMRRYVSYGTELNPLFLFSEQV